MRFAVLATLLLAAPCFAAGPYPVEEDVVPPPAPPSNCANGNCATSRIDYLSYRAATGHTHTCPKCGNVWDHSTNPTHNCAVCGTEQRYQDSSVKLVPISATVPMEAQQVVVKSASVESVSVRSAVSTRFSKSFMERRGPIRGLLRVLTGGRSAGCG